MEVMEDMEDTANRDNNGELKEDWEDHNWEDNGEDQEYGVHKDLLIPMQVMVVGDNKVGVDMDNIL